MANGGAAPNRLLAGQATKLSRTMHDIRYDEIHDEFVVTNPFAQAIMTFAGAANGNSPPLRVIQGPSTKMTGAGRVEVDPVHDEIFVPSGSSILVYPRKANGDVAPLRTIRGPDTSLRSASATAVDPAHNVLVVGLEGGPGRPGGLVTFERTAEGNAKPRGVIRGPKSGIIRINQMALYPPRKRIVATQPGDASQMEPEGAFVGVWNLDDSGDVAPRWRIDANQKTKMKKPRGIAIDPKNKEVIVADMRMNSVLTFYFPEIF